jgi:hypothetical protein
MCNSSIFSSVILSENTLLETLGAVGDRSMQIDGPRDVRCLNLESSMISFQMFIIAGPRGRCVPCDQSADSPPNESEASLAG